MSKTTIRENFCVEVEPRDPNDFGFARIGKSNQSEKDWERDCEEIAQQIRRHVDGVKAVHVVWDTQHVCSHCGAGWTEATDDHNGGCCSTDAENVPEETS